MKRDIAEENSCLFKLRRQEEKKFNKIKDVEEKTRQFKKEAIKKNLFKRELLVDHFEHYLIHHDASKLFYLFDGAIYLNISDVSYYTHYKKQQIIRNHTQL